MCPNEEKGCSAWDLVSCRAENLLSNDIKYNINYGNMGFHGNQIGDMVPILLVKNVLLTFQMELNGMFLDISKYESWILHTKLV